jgi:hypothetical protein
MIAWRFHRPLERVVRHLPISVGLVPSCDLSGIGVKGNFSGGPVPVVPHDERPEVIDLGRATEESFNIGLSHALPKLAPSYFVWRYTRSRRLVMQLSLKRRYPALKGLYGFFEVLDPGRNAVVGMSPGGDHKQKS